MKSSSTSLNPCWHCGNPNNAVTDLEGDAVPNPGDVSICIQCGTPAIFTEDLTTRKPTDEEIAMILQDKDALSYMAAIAMLHGLRLG